MSDRTMLVVGTGKFSVPRIVKRTIQIAIATALTAAVLFVMVVGNGLLIGQRGTMQGYNAWLNFIARGDVLPMIVLTAVVTTLYLAWDRGREKK